VGGAPAPPTGFTSSVSCGFNRRSQQGIAGRTTTEEDIVKTMAIRLDDELHEQLSILAQLENTSITELIRTAIEQHLRVKRNDPGLAAQADEILAEIDAQATKRREAISALFEPAPAKTARRSRKAPVEGE